MANFHRNLSHRSRHLLPLMILRKDERNAMVSFLAPLLPPPSSACQPDFERAGGREPWRCPSPSPANASPSDLRLAPTSFAPLSLLSIAEWIIARFIVDEEREGRTQSASSSSTPTSSRRMTIRKIILSRRCDDREDLISMYGQTRLKEGPIGLLVHESLTKNNG